MEKLAEAAFIFAAVIAIAAVFGSIVGFLAKYKGYEFRSWFFAGAVGFGIIPLLFLVFLPAANAPNLPEGERLFRIERGNRIGRRVGAALLILVVARLLLRL